jgi:hypothetical protein
MPNSAYDVPPTWNSGIATRLRSPGSIGASGAELHVCATMLRCDSITPFGRPVVPELYITSHRSSTVRSAAPPAGRAAARNASYASSGPPTTITSVTRGSRSRMAATAGSNSAPANSTVAPESLIT